MRTPKLLLIAVDSGDSQLVREWASQGYLPAFAELLDAGRSAPMKTPVGVLEGAIWPTLLTSSSPGGHGMFAYRQLDPGSYRLDAIMRADRLPSPPFWNPLSAAGKRVAIIDAPFARPAADLNGIQVTNWGAHDAWSRRARNGGGAPRCPALGAPGRGRLPARVVRTRSRPRLTRIRRGARSRAPRPRASRRRCP